MTARAKSKRKPEREKAARIREALIGASGRKQAPPPVAVEPVALGPGRKGKRSIAIYMTPLAKEVLDGIAAKHKRSVQQLGIEALNLLFRAYDEKPVA